MSDQCRVRILVVDDDRMVLTMVCRMLDALGCETVGAHDGLEALSRFEREEFHLVVTDLQMPHMNGWMLARRLKSLAPGTPILAMTGLSPEEVMERPGKNALDRILYKPLNLDQLEDAVATALESPYLKSACA